MKRSNQSGHQPLTHKVPFIIIWLSVICLQYNGIYLYLYIMVGSMVGWPMSFLFGQLNCFICDINKNILFDVNMEAGIMYAHIAAEKYQVRLVLHSVHLQRRVCNNCFVINPDSKVHRANMVAHLGPVGPRWAPCGPHEPCYQGGEGEITWA